MENGGGRLAELAIETCLGPEFVEIEFSFGLGAGDGNDGGIPYHGFALAESFLPRTRLTVRGSIEACRFEVS